MCFILSDLKCYGNATSSFKNQALKTIFEVQRKRSNEKITKGKINFPTYKTYFFFRPLLFSNLITFLFDIPFK